MCFTKKKKAAQLKNLLTEGGLSGVLENEETYVVDIVFLFVAFFTGGSFAF